MRNLGNYIYDYAHSFFGEDFEPKHKNALVFMHEKTLYKNSTNMFGLHNNIAGQYSLCVYRLYTFDASASQIAIFIDIFITYLSICLHIYHIIYKYYSKYWYNPIFMELQIFR